MLQSVWINLTLRSMCHIYRGFSVLHLRSEVYLGNNNLITILILLVFLWGEFTPLCVELACQLIPTVLSYLSC